DVDHEPVADVSASLAAERLRALAPQALDGPMLGPGWNPQALRAVQGGYLDDGAADRLWEGQWHLDLEAVADPLEDRRVGHPGDHIQIAWLASARSRLALARDSDAAAVAHPRGDVDPQPAHAPLGARTAARGARIVDYGAGAPAVGTWLRDRKDALALGLHAAPLTHGADSWRGSRLGA